MNHDENNIEKGLHMNEPCTIPNETSSGEVFNAGYVAGYNQARVDGGLMSQTDADAILRRSREI